MGLLPCPSQQWRAPTDSLQGRLNSHLTRTHLPACHPTEISTPDLANNSKRGSYKVSVIRKAKRWLAVLNWIEFHRILYYPVLVNEREKSRGRIDSCNSRDLKSISKPRAIFAEKPDLLSLFKGLVFHFMSKWWSQVGELRSWSTIGGRIDLDQCTHSSWFRMARSQIRAWLASIKTDVLDHQLIMNYICLFVPYI